MTDHVWTPTNGYLSLVKHPILPMGLELPEEVS